MTNLLTQIQNAFAKADAESIAAVPAATIEARTQYMDLKERLYNAIDTYGRKSDEAGKLRFVLRDRFGKTFVNDFNYGEVGHIKRQLTAVKRTHEARNARIHKKMADAGIKNIDADNFEIVWGEDFQGFWVIDGFNVRINVIWAGGYNIQRLHHRVLVNVKKAKLAA